VKGRRTKLLKQAKQKGTWVVIKPNTNQLMKENPHLPRLCQYSKMIGCIIKGHPSPPLGVNGLV